MIRSCNPLSFGVLLGGIGDGEGLIDISRDSKVSLVDSATETERWKLGTVSRRSANPISKSGMYGEVQRTGR